MKKTAAAVTPDLAAYHAHVCQCDQVLLWYSAADCAAGACQLNGKVNPCIVVLLQL